MQRKQKGFTLVEILIVVIILGILAAIIIPQFTEASGEAKKSSLESNLQMLRSQCELFKVQHNDIYPWQTKGADGTLAIADDIASAVDKLTLYTDAFGTTNPEKTDTFCFGPYMQTIPNNPFCTDPAAEYFGAAADDTVHWAIIDTDSNSLEDGCPGLHD